MSNNTIDSFKNLSSRYRKYYTYIEPIISDPLVRSYFGLVASLLLITFLIVFALSPTINVILGLQKQISDQQNTITALDTKISSLVQAQEAYNKAEAFIPLLNQALPENPAPQAVISDVHKVASASGVAIVAFQIQPAPVSRDLPLGDTPLGVPALKIVLSFNGSKAQIGQFLGALERQLRYIRIDSFTMLPDVKSTGFAVEANIMAYFFHL